MEETKGPKMQIARAKKEYAYLDDLSDEHFNSKVSEIQAFIIEESSRQFNKPSALPGAP